MDEDQLRSIKGPALPYLLDPVPKDSVSGSGNEVI